MKKIIFFFLLIAFLLGLLWALEIYFRVFGKLDEANAQHILYIPTGSAYEDVLNILKEEHVVKNIRDFDWLAKKMNYPNKVFPGRYLIGGDYTNRDLIEKLRGGKQDPVQVVLGKFRTKNELAGHVAKRLEVDSFSILRILNDEIFLSKYNLTKDNVMTVFIPNSYEFYWNTNAEKFFEKMYKESEKFWQGDREQQARNNNLNPVQAVVLASIVEEESQVADERPLIAGVYLNRLQKNIKLQADPTVKFAVNNFALRRILTIHTKYDSPYNTYLHPGLPPGPICTPSINSIEAVLHPQKHDYIFFCAKDDFSGRHVFSSTYREHQANARKFQAALNRNNIK